MLNLDTEPPEHVGPAKASSLERMLSLLDFFTYRKPVWSVGGLVKASGFTQSAVYRYINELADSGLVAPVQTGRYSLGPRIIQLNRQLTLSDPMLVAMQSIEAELPQLSETQKWHLCRLFRDRVIAIGEYGNLDAPLSYQRGNPMPLFRGATSTAILAWLPERQLMRLYLENQPDGEPQNFAASWPAYKKKLAAIRKQGFASAFAEIDPEVNVFGIAAPIFNVEGKVIGSISNVRPMSLYRPELLEEQGRAIAELARRITNDVNALAADMEEA